MVDDQDDKVPEVPRNATIEGNMAFQKGQDAKAKGKSKRSNPYRSSEFRRLWMEGWALAGR